MIVVDIETTGWDVQTRGIFSIGAVDFEHASNQFYGECKIRDEATLEESAFLIHGMTEDQLRDPKKQSEESLIRQFDAWTANIQDKTLAGHNVGFFDRSFLLASYLRNGLTWKYSRRTVDLHTLAYTTLRKLNNKIPQDGETSGLSLDAILEYLGLPKEPRPHNALTGAKAETECFSRLLFAKNLLPEYRNIAIKN